MSKRSSVSDTNNYRNPKSVRLNPEISGNVDEQQNIYTTCECGKVVNLDNLENRRRHLESSEHINGLKQIKLVQQQPVMSKFFQPLPKHSTTHQQATQSSKLSSQYSSLSMISARLSTFVSDASSSSSSPSSSSYCSDTDVNCGLNSIFVSPPPIDVDSELTKITSATYAIYVNELTQLQLDLTLGLPSDAFPSTILPLPSNNQNVFPYGNVIVEPILPTYRQSSLNDCFICHKRYPLEQMKHHIGWHLSHGDKAVGEEDVIGEPCGFCGRINSPCSTSTKNPVNDCIYYHFFQNRKKPSSSNPCTNRPVMCPIAGDDCTVKPCVWKYNIAIHIGTTHPHHTLSDEQKQKYSISQQEQDLLDEMFKEKRSGKQKKRINNKHQPTKKTIESNTVHEEYKYDDSDDDDVIAFQNQSVITFDD